MRSSDIPNIALGTLDTVGATPGIEYSLVSVDFIKNGTELVVSCPDSHEL
jgi:hypothetical protein